MFTLLTARYYGASAFGLFALGFTIIQIAAVISRVGTDTLLMKKIAQFGSHTSDSAVIIATYTNIIIICALVSIFVSFLLLVYAQEINELIFDIPEMTAVIRICGCAVIPTVFLFVHRDGIRGFQRFLPYALMRHIAPFGFSLVILLLISLVSNNKLSPIISYSFSMVMTAVLAVVIFIIEFKKLIKDKFTIHIVQLH